MNTSTELIEAVKSLNEAQMRAVHAATAIPLPTLAKIRYGQTADPRGSTLDALRVYFASVKKRKPAKKETA